MDLSEETNYLISDSRDDISVSTLEKKVNSRDW